ncbi:MAG: iron-sulfur cluster assembly accessory protein [Alphaproteobacteria bacterium]
MALGAAIQISDAAAARVKQMLADADDGVIGVKLGVKARGCSGLKYDMSFVREVAPHDEVVEDKGVTVIIDPAAVMFLLGSTMDYRDDAFESGFVFKNPNAKGTCGCGESFHV